MNNLCRNNAGNRRANEKDRRIEEKIDRQLLEYKRQMELIIALLTRKTGSRIENKTTKQADRVEEYRSEDGDEEEDGFY